MLLRSVEKSLRRCRRWLPMAPRPELPLLDEAMLLTLAARARSLAEPLFEFPHYTSHPLIGEALSFRRGQGFEFEENRHYQPGDPPRLLNWRLYARTDQLYTKAFTEERRPPLVLVFDRRAAMRFGTRRQLKVAQAAKVAACCAYQAGHFSLPVGGLLLDRSAEWFAPAMGDVALQRLLHAVSAPCPPMDFEDDQPDFEESLLRLTHHLPPGCALVLLSDFSDLDAAGVPALLHRLAARHGVRAFQILDPVEQRLPASGDLRLDDPASRRPLRIDGRDRGQQTSYAEAFDKRQAQLLACFRACGIPLTTCTTQDDIRTCLGPGHAADDAD